VTPEYLEELADRADPDKLWRVGGFYKDKLTPEQVLQVDTGVALRRHADHVRRLRDLLGKERSLLLTPLSVNGIDVRTVRPPTDVLKRLRSDGTPKEPKP
jgi:hypothetical protein